MRWTGNGLADGTTLTSGNINTAGNGDTLAAPSGTMVTAGDGFTFGSATAAQINRQNVAFTASKAAAAQLFYTPAGSPTTANERLGNFRSASVNATGFSHSTTGILSFEQGTTEIVASRTPALIAGHKYQIDWVTALSASPTTSNGRMFWRVRDLTDSTWNTTGEFFYDTLYTINAGTADLSILRVGKLAGTGVVSTSSVMEQMGWDVVTVNPADTSLAAASAYFMSSPASSYSIGSVTTAATSTVSAAVATPNIAVTFAAASTVAAAATVPWRATGLFGGIGDSTWYQDGFGEARIKAKLLPKGYTSSQVGFYGCIGKTWFAADDNGKTVPQNIADIRTALGGEPDVWLFNLGGNGSGRTETQVRGDIDIAFDTIGTFHRILFVALSQAEGDTLYATRVQWNGYAKTRVLERGGEWLDWHTYVKARPDEATLWQADLRHMTNTGYDVKNTYTTNAVGTSEAGKFLEPAPAAAGSTSAASAAVGQSMAATVAAVSTSAATASGKLTAAATVTAVSAVTAAPKSRQRFSATSVAVSSSDATLIPAGSSSATTVATSASSGALTVRQGVSAGVAAVSTTSGAVALRQPAVAVTVAVSAVTAGATALQGATAQTAATSATAAAVGVSQRVTPASAAAVSSVNGIALSQQLWATVLNATAAVYIVVTSSSPDIGLPSLANLSLVPTGEDFTLQSGAEHYG